MPSLRLRAAALLATGVTALGLVAAPAAQAHAPRTHHRSLGTTTVTTAPGIASTLLKARIVPLPVPGTSSASRCGAVSRCPTASRSRATPPIWAPARGDILHSGGIKFVSRQGLLEIGKFDIDLAAGKVFATQVNFAPAPSRCSISTCRS